MKRIAIYGAGGLGREVAQMIDQINANTPQWDMIGYFDDHIPCNTPIKKMKVLGGIEELNGLKEGVSLIIGIADNRLRSEVVSKIKNSRVTYPVLIHPSVVLDIDEVQLGEGSIITAGNILTTDIKIGMHCIINLGCTIGHDVILGDYCSIMPRVHLSGSIKASENVLIGTGARVLQNLKIGKNAKIGAGAVVTKNVESGHTVVGVPARILRKND